MIGATAKAEQFYTRSGSESTKASRKGVNLLNWGEQESLSPEQKRTVLITAKRQLQKDVANIKASIASGISRDHPKVLSDARDEMLKKMLAIDAELSILKCVIGRRGKQPDLGEYIIAMYRASVTRHQWDCILAEAERQFNSDHSADAKEARQ